MKRFALVLLCLFAVVAPVLADYDPVLEAEEEAKRVAAAREARAREAEAAAIKKRYEAEAHKRIMDDKRKTLGSAANGKSEAEINALYDQQMKARMAEATRGAAEASAAMKSKEANESMKQATGKSLTELQNMSPEQLEAFAAEMESKFGQMAQ